MRTTVTLDRDVDRLLKEEMHRTRKPFKEIVNSAIRSGLRRRPASPRRLFVVKPQALGMHAGIDPAGFNRLADDLEVDAVVEKMRRRAQRK